MSPRELARITLQYFGESAAPLAVWLIKLEEIRYSKHTDATDIASLKTELKSITWPVK